MAEERFDRVVLGAGIIGACTAHQLTAAGHRRVLLLDQFPLPHSRGSSHGHSRAIHTAYRDTVQGQMARRARQIWDDIQRRTGQTLVQEVPMLVVGSRAPDVHQEFTTLASCLDDRTTIQGTQLTAALPAAEFGADALACVDRTAGILLADKCLATITGLFTAAGGHLRPSWPVSDIAARGDEVVVRGPRGTIVTRGLVVCAGAWTAPLLAPLGVDLTEVLTPLRIPVMYWRVRDGYKTPMSGIDIRDKDADIYWLPSTEYPGLLKLCPHFGTPCDPDNRDAVSVDDVMSRVSNYVRNIFPGIEDRPALVETCMYTCTPDWRCILDVHPRHSNIVIAAGMSGQGFKMGPVFGEVLQQLIDGQQAHYDLSSFSLRCFKSHARL